MFLQRRKACLHEQVRRLLVVQQLLLDERHARLVHRINPLGRVVALALLPVPRLLRRGRVRRRFEVHVQNAGLELSLILAQLLLLVPRPRLVLQRVRVQVLGLEDVRDRERRVLEPEALVQLGLALLAELGDVAEATGVLRSPYGVVRVARAGADPAELHQASLVGLLVGVRAAEVVDNVVLSLEVVAMLLALESPVVNAHDFLVEVPCVP